MQTIFIGLVILLAVSSVGMAILYLLYKVDKYPKSHEKFIDSSVYRSHIGYDHIEEEIPKVKKRKKPNTTNVKRKYNTSKRSNNDKNSPMA